jgi:hypothetical protein
VRAEHLEEPELEFGRGGRHIDVRFGLATYGPLDADSAAARRELRVGIVGTPQTNQDMRSWLMKCSAGVSAKKSKLPNLFPRFPGFSNESPFSCSLLIDRQLSAEVLPSQLLANGNVDVGRAVSVFIEHAERLIEDVQPDVIICAPPSELSTLEVAKAPTDASIASDGAEEESEREEDRRVVRRHGDFHDLLKARGLELSVPMQMAWPPTYGGITPDELTQDRLQDEATRAWNFHVALYYKSGGIPWRIARESTDYTTCYVGIAFYKTLDNESLRTSMAQVFNARGEGIIVRGGPARYEKEDRQVHISEEDAHALLSRALATYRVEHKTSPARVVVHKSSHFDDAERSGMRRATDGERISTLELLSLRKSDMRLFRAAYYPPLRGTVVTLDRRNLLMYLRGSVPFYGTWPGMYVPRPLNVRLDDTQQAASFLAREILALSKQSWNDTQFDGGWPITLDAPDRIGAIMRYVSPTATRLQSRYAFYM